MCKMFLMIFSLLLATVAPSYAVTDAMFIQGIPLVEGQEVNAMGIVEYHTHAKDASIVGAYARLRVNNGEFDILLDSVGKKLASEKDGIGVMVRGTVTGKAYDKATNMIVSSAANSDHGKARVPQIRIMSFE